MNLLSYVDKYGCYSFKDVPFNEVDNAIFSSLSYLDLKGIVSPNRFSPMKIRDVAEIYFRNYVKGEKQILSIRNAIKIFREIKDSVRYGDLLLYNYIYEEGENEQFSAITIEIHPKLVYVSFEGTDHLVSGWKEDFMFSYTFPTISQRKAIDYINKRFLFRRKEIILGGHSKGGNLAIVAGMYANFLVRDKIIMIYNNDGPGLLKEQMESDYYKKIESKLIHIVPNYSIVGLLLHHNNNYIVVRSNRRSFWSHDLFTWVVQDRYFMRSELSLFSKTLESRVLEWMNQYNKEQREKFVTSLFDIFDRANITSLVDVMENKKLIFHLITEAKDLDKDDRIILKDFLGMLFRCFKDVGKGEIMSFFEKK